MSTFVSWPGRPQPADASPARLASTGDIYAGWAVALLLLILLLIF